MPVFCTMGCTFDGLCPCVPWPAWLDWYIHDWGLFLAPCTSLALPLPIPNPGKNCWFLGWLGCPCALGWPHAVLLTGGGGSGGRGGGGPFGFGS